MPTIQVASADKRRVDDLMEFVRRFFAELPVEARFMFAIEISRLLKPEIDELKRKAQCSSES